MEEKERIFKKSKNSASERCFTQTMDNVQKCYCTFFRIFLQTFCQKKRKIHYALSDNIEIFNFSCHFLFKKGDRLRVFHVYSKAL